MRKLLAAAVALAPIAFAAGAHAETVISNTRTSPISTANADDGAPDDVRIANNGTIELDSGAAITLNSDNDVTIDQSGRITMEDADAGAAGILAQGGNTGSIIINGTISLTEDYTPEDEDDDGDLDGPFAEGEERYGVRVVGAAPLDGDIQVGSRASITVEGNDSYGIDAQPGLSGDLEILGAISVIGDRSYGARVGDVGGDARLGGVITVRGEDAEGVALEGDIGGELRIDGTFSATGYRYTTRPTNTEALENLDADDLLQGGPAIRISGDVGGGVLLASTAPDYDPDEDEDGDADTDNDGVPDSQQTTASISTYGSAPSILIGSETRDVTIGQLEDSSYGFVNRGGILSTGVYDGVSALGIQFGIGGSGQSTVIAGGVRNEGQIESRAFRADATTLHFEDGASTPLVSNSGSLLANVSTLEEATATGVLIEDSASVSRVENSGQISASVNGSEGNAVAIRDLSGTLSEIDNIGVIQAQITPRRNNDGDLVPITGDSVALDLRANTTGVDITQRELVIDPDEPPENGIINPYIAGDILLGSGGDTLDIRDGYIVGDIDFGGGADALIISGDAQVRGALSNADGLSIDVASGLLDARQTNRIDIAELSVGEGGDLIVTIDPEAGTAGGFNVTGTADFADGAGLGVRFNSLIEDSERYTIIEAGTLTFGDIEQDSLVENSPYLFVVEADADVAAGEVYVDVRRRTASEMDMIASESSAYDAVYTALRDNDELRAIFLDQTDREAFIGLYEQMLPDHSGGSLVSLASGVDAVTRALAGRNNSAARGETSAWLQEINFYADRESGQAYGFKSEGIGLAGGIERGTAMGAIGVSTAFTSSDMEDPAAQAEERLSATLLELGLYWRAQGGNWTTWARAAGGYASFESVRQFVGEGVVRRADADWNGYTLAAGAGASYEYRSGRYSLRPEVIVDYFALNEDGFQESGGGDGFDLEIGDREGHILSTTAAVSIGMGFGENHWLRPELRLGWRQIISHDGGVTSARFLSGGPNFDLMADSLEGGGPVVGFRLNVGNELGLLAIEADAEMLEDYIRYALLLRASFKF